VKTVKNNIEDLLEEGSLLSTKFRSQLPRTISDAIELTSLLGQQFLWVDTLCIIQDEDSIRQLEINQMSAIYANAILTIVASDGQDANHGLRGIKELSSPQPRKSQQKVLPFVGGRSLLVLYANSQSDVNTQHFYGDSLYRTRCWTLQEFCFSKRQMVFHRGNVYWACSIMDPCRHEWDRLEKYSLSILDSEHMDAPTVPHMWLYTTLVPEFNSRSISFESDRMDAFAGIASMINVDFEGGFISGLPEMFFDLALLWQHTSSIARRHNLEKDHQDRRPSTPHGLPSWSWIGWQGPITMQPWSSLGNAFSYSNGSIRDFPSVLSRCSWSTAEIFDSTE
jgi:hypothetical protein